MEDFSHEQAMAEFDDFYGPSTFSSSPPAPDGHPDAHIGLKRNSDGDAMLLDAPPPPMAMSSATAATCVLDGNLRRSPELTELHNNHTFQEPAELGPSTALPNSIAGNVTEQHPPVPKSTDISFLIHTTPPPSDMEQGALVTNAGETSALPQALQHLPPATAHTHDVPEDSPPDPEIYGNASALVTADMVADEPQVELAESSRSPSSPTTSQEDRPPVTPTDEVQETRNAHVPTELELPAMYERFESHGPEHKMQEAPSMAMPIETDSLATHETFDTQVPKDEMQEAQKTSLPIATESVPTQEQFAAPQVEVADAPHFAVLQSPKYVPSSMMLQAVSEFLPQQATPVPPSSSHRSELHAEMRAEEDAASSPIRPAPVSAFLDRLNNLPVQLPHAIEPSDWSLDRYGNIVFEDNESEDESKDQQTKPKEASPEESAIEVAKAPRPKRIQPSRIRPDADRPHWAQLKKPAPQKLPPRIKKVPVQTRVLSTSPPASGFKFPPQAPPRNVSTRSSAATIADARPARGTQLEDTSSSLSELSSHRSPSPPPGVGEGMPKGRTAAPSLAQPVHAPSARLQLQPKPKQQAAKKRPKPLNNLVASMVPPEFDNTGGSFVEPRERENEIIMDGATPPPSPKRKGAAKAPRKRPHADEETVYDEEGNLVVLAATATATAPAPAPKRTKPDRPKKKKVSTKPPLSKELMSIVGASVMADVRPNSPRKTRNQKRDFNAIAPNASAAAKRRHTKPEKLIA